MIKKSNWPPGPFAIPTPIDGCEESYPEGWTEGYVNITTRVPMEIWITQNDDDFGKATKINETNMFNIAEDRLHKPYTLGPYGRYTFQFNFCYKSRKHTNNSMNAWPPGHYSIYGTEDGCPTGKENLISIGTFSAIDMFPNCDIVQLFKKRKFNCKSRPEERWATGQM